jgi:cell division protein ZapA
MPHTEPVRVTIFNQTYSLVASEEPGRIEALAQKVDDLMSSIAVRAGNIDATRAAVLACLHLADELETLERSLANLKHNVDHKARKFTVLLDEAMNGQAVSDRAQEPIADEPVANR